MNDDAMEKMNKLFKLVHDIPKVELHAHIGGCIRPQTFMNLAVERDINCEHIDFYNVDIKMAFEIFKVTDKLMVDCQTLDRVTREIVEDYSKHNCRYLELRSTPKVVGKIPDRETYIETVVNALVTAESECNMIKTGYLISINRSQPVEIAREVIDLALKMRKLDDPKYKKIVGIEMSGDPRKGNFADFADEFKRAQENGLKISLHCAETAEQGDAQQMIDAKPDRLGHCCYLTKEQIQQVVDLKIPVEICPTSNVAATQCGLPSFLKHLQEFWRLEHNIIICTDDTLLFNTNISMELFEFAKAVNLFDASTLKKLLGRNLEAIFLDDASFKTKIIAEIESKY